MRRRWAGALVVLIASLSLVAPTSAQRKRTATSSQGNTLPSRHALAREWWRKFGFEDATRREFEASMSRAMDSLQLMKPEQRETMAKLRNYVTKEIPTSVNVIMDSMAAPLAREFSNVELKEMLTWTPPAEPVGPLVPRMKRALSSLMDPETSKEFGEKVAIDLIFRALDHLDEPARSYLKHFYTEFFKTIKNK